jgi:heme-degrading monooxygenase HmoA
MILPMLLIACTTAHAAAADSFACAPDGTRVQQLRIYEIDRENRDAFHERFRDHALRIMKKHGFEVVDLWESDTGDKLQLIYVLDWPDEATMESAWRAFLADAEWIDIKRRTAERHGRFVHDVKGQVLKRLVHGPACKDRADPK